MKAIPLIASVAVVIGCNSADSARGRTLPPPAASADAPQQFGAALEPSSVLPLREVLSKPSEFAGKTVTVDGKVRSNCTAKGCWMELAEGLDKSLQGCRVTFKNYGFFVPLDSAGAKARVQGTVMTKTVAKGEVDHLEAEGATFPGKQPDGTATEVRIVATGVELFRGS
jgi:hypothetical protein